MNKIIVMCAFFLFMSFKCLAQEIINSKGRVTVNDINLYKSDTIYSEISDLIHEKIESVELFLNSDKSLEEDKFYPRIILLEREHYAQQRGDSNLFFVERIIDSYNEKYESQNFKVVSLLQEESELILVRFKYISIYIQIVFVPTTMSR